MIKRVAVAIFVLAALIVGLKLAPADAAVECPAIKVIADQMPDKQAQFSASVRGSSAKLDYHWSISQGGIKEGQNTATVVVEGLELNSSVTATVEIAGLPDACSNTSNATLDMLPPL